MIGSKCTHFDEKKKKCRQRSCQYKLSNKDCTENGHPEYFNKPGKKKFKGHMVDWDI